MYSRLKNYLFYISAVLLLLSAILHITEDRFLPHIIIYYIYAVSGAGVAIAYLSDTYKGNNLRLKRLNFQQTIAAILLPISSYFMFKERNEWFVLLFISAILQLYIQFVKTKEEKKESTGKI